MTRIEAINQFKELRKGQPFDEKTLVRWLSDFEGQVYSEVILTHKDSEGISYKPFSRLDKSYESDKNLPLLIPEPYSKVYIYYLLSQADFHLNERERYVYSRGEFEKAYDKFKKYYHSRHAPAVHYKLKV